jgi:hypothetical protein
MKMLFLSKYVLLWNLAASVFGGLLKVFVEVSWYRNVLINVIDCFHGMLMF